MDYLIRKIDACSLETAKQWLEHIKRYYTDWQQSRILNPDQPVDTQIRSSTGLTLSMTDPVVLDIHDSLNLACEKYAAELQEAYPEQHAFKFPLVCAPDTTSHHEGMQVLKYEAGQHYNWHSDSEKFDTQSSHGRCMSVVLYLNDDFDGGGTEFIHTAVEPEAGKALIFPSDWCFVHRAQKVTRGTKYAIVTWYHVKRVLD